MKEQFVTYEIALKLKYLGFDEECLGDYYIIPSDKTPNPNGEFLGLKYEDVSSYTRLVSASLWQQAIDWLREKHNIHIVVSGKLIDSSEHKIYPWEIYGDFEELPGEPYEGLDKDYYRAREQAILKAIELCQKK